ncbi:MAG: SMC-Scp complex subunit ScpB [Candidatus Nanoarchaeia archaeon]|jgi:segregation and condensation protein B
MDDMQNRVEAVLFITGSFMTIDDIGKSAGIGSEGIVKEAVQKLKQSYDERQGSLEIIENEGKYKIALRRDYVQFSTKLLSNTELDRPTQETLAIIAYKQPILQADLIKIRGNGAYDHIHNLKEANFITSEKFGRTRKLKLAPKFYDYFDIAGDMLKSKCDEIGLKVGTVEKIGEKKEQVSLEGYKGEAVENIADAAEPSNEAKEDAKEDDDDDETQPDPEDIQPDKPEPHDPREKPEDNPDDKPEEPDEPKDDPDDEDDPDDNPDNPDDEQDRDLSEDEKA